VNNKIRTTYTELLNDTQSNSTNNLRIKAVINMFKQNMQTLRYQAMSKNTGQKGTLTTLLEIITSFQ
jgi:hypothetical protein